MEFHRTALPHKCTVAFSTMLLVQSIVQAYHFAKCFLLYFVHMCLTCPLSVHHLLPSHKAHIFLRKGTKTPSCLSPLCCWRAHCGGGRITFLLKCLPSTQWFFLLLGLKKAHLLKTLLRALLKITRGCLPAKVVFNPLSSCVLSGERKNWLAFKPT